MGSSSSREDDAIAHRGSVSVLQDLLAGGHPWGLLTSDVFDTVLLRDHSTETARLAEAATRAARRLGLDPASLVDLRWSMQASAYRAVAIERPTGEARLDDITRRMSQSLDLGPDGADMLRSCEVDVDIAHLRAHQAVLDVLARARATGLRVVAVSDTYYNTADLSRMLRAVIGSMPFDAVYSSADLGATKHAGSIFADVTRLEGVPASEILHVGDDPRADVDQAARAGWSTVHLPRSVLHHRRRQVGRLGSARLIARRAR